MRSDPRATALAFVERYFADALVALLAGSVARGEATITSDLDLVLITQDSGAPYRETFMYEAWPVEAFVYTPTSYATWFQRDSERRRPSLPTMCAEGLVLRDRIGLATRVKQEAEVLLKRGPEPLPPKELAAARYQLTDLLMDLESCSESSKTFVALALIPALADLICDTHQQWRGAGKWMPRAIAGFSPDLADKFQEAVTTALRFNRTQPLIELADETLAAVGGRLYEGYSLGKP